MDVQKVANHFKRILYLYFAHLKNKLKPMISRNRNYEEQSQHSAKHLLCAGMALISWLGTLAHNGSGIREVPTMENKIVNQNQTIK